MDPGDDCPRESDTALFIDASEVSNFSSARIVDCLAISSLVNFRRKACMPTLALGILIDLIAAAKISETD